MRVKRMLIGHAEVFVMRVSFSGELAYELHVPNEQLLLTYRLLRDAGEEHGLVQFGLYATESMRLEKGYLHWKADLITEFNPFEAGLERFVHWTKAEFMGRDALQAEQARGDRRRLVVMTLDCDHAPAHGGDPVYRDDRQVGSVTSAGYGHRVKKNIAYAYVDADASGQGTALTVGILGEQFAAEVVSPCLYDPENRRVRS